MGSLSVTPEQEADALLLHAAIAGLPALTRANGGPPAGHAALVRRLQRMADDLSVSRSRRPFGSMGAVAVSRCGCRLAAAVLGVSQRQVERYVASGRLDASGSAGRSCSTSARSASWRRRGAGMAGTSVRQRPPETVRELEHAAEQAEHQAAAMEAAALTTGATVDLREIDERREAGRRFRFGAEVRRRADQRAASAERDAALAVLAADVETAAKVADPAVLEAALAEVTAAARRFTELIGAHNAAVAALVSRARALAVGEPAPSGPRPEHGHVAIVGGEAVQAGVTMLRPCRGTAELIRRAAEGSTVRLPAAVSAQSPPRRPGRVFVNRAGSFVEWSGGALPPAFPGSSPRVISRS